MGAAVLDPSLLDRLAAGTVVEEELARTARAVVYRVRSAAGDRPLALKVSLLPSDAEDLARFRHEVRLLSEARHPNVIEVVDFGVLPGDYPFLTMELLAPASLAAAVARGGTAAVWSLAIQAAAGLAHIHRQGVIHMDIKPGNLGLAAGGPADELRLKILDFGLAQVVYGPLDRRIRGTLAYTAPEVLLQDSYDHRADLYSLGMTLYELATGVLPSAGDDSAALRFHLEGAAPDPLTLRPDLPPSLAGILLKLLRRDPAERYLSASRLLEDLCRASGRELAASPSPAGTLLAARLIGQQEVLGRLQGALRDARQGRGGAFMLEGPEGVGKSRILRELRLSAAIEGARVGRGRGLAERPSALGPVLEALRAVGVEPQIEPRQSPGEGDPHERFRLYGATAHRLRLASRAGPPIVLLLDDLHLAGPESDELLAYLAEELRTLPALVVAARRPGQGREMPGVELLPLAACNRAETEQLVDACLGTSGLHPTFYGWVFEQSAGIAGEILRLLRQLVDDAVLVFRDGEWKPSLPSLSRALHGGEQRASRARLRVAALPRPLREVLDAVSVMAEPSSLATLVAVLGEPAQAVYERLQDLVAAGVLDRLHEAAGTLYTLAEPRLQAALYAELDPDRRALLHRVAGEALARLPEVAPAAVAEHFWRAGVRERGLAFFQLSAEQAQAVYAFADAAVAWGRVAETLAGRDGFAAARALYAQAEATISAGRYGRALELLSGIVPPGDGAGEAAPSRQLRARAAWLSGRLHTRLGQHEAALASHRAGLGILAPEDDPALGLDLRHAEAIALRDLGDWSAAFATARAALAEAGRPGLERQRALLLSSLGLLYFSRADWRRAGRLVRRALLVAARTGHEDLALALRNNLGTILWKVGDFEAALAHHRENLPVCRRTNDLWGEIYTLNNLGVLEASRGNWRAAREPLARSLELKRRLGLRENEAVARVNLGEVEEVLGEWNRAQRHYDRALKLLADAPEHRERRAALVQLASLERKRGRCDAAERLAREALEAAEREGDRELVAQCRLQLGLVERDRDNPEGALQHLGEALALAEGTGTRQLAVRIRLTLADLASRGGDLGQADEHCKEARLAIAELGDRVGRAKLLSLEARGAYARGETDRADRLFADAERLCEELEAPFDLARTLYEWGVRTWNADASLHRLERAQAAFARLGARVEAVRAAGAVARVRESQRCASGSAVSSVLHEVGKVINSSLDLQEVLNRTMDLVLERLGAERGMILLVNRITRELEIAAVRNLGGENQEEGRNLSESVVKRVLETREPVLAMDAQTDGRFAGVESIVASHILSILCVPLTIRERPAGAIYIDHRKARHLFGASDVEFLVAFADQAAIAIDNARLYGEIEAARERLKEENESLRSEILARHSLASLIGRSRPIEELKRVLEKVAQSSSTVLIRGESGSGKGLAARILHAISPRRRGPFIHFNCAALPETLVESELFGHEKGAFTGAAGQKPGRFELASHGTIFLDEVGKVTLAVQAKLLRVVEDKEFERVGGTRTLHADVRIVAATNLDLEAAVRRQDFLEDLYYRLNVIPIDLPPLRRRREDIPFLVEHFLTKICRDLGRPLMELAPEVLDLFAAYAWPGNIRELESALHRAVVLSGEGPLAAADFGWIAEQVHGREAPRPGPIAPRPTAPRPAEPGRPEPSAVELAGGGYEEALAGYDRQLIGAALAQSDGKIRETARLLGIARNTLRAKMKKYGMVFSTP